MKTKLLITMVLFSALLNAQNKIESSIHELYDSGTSTYQNSTGSDYAYDSNNNLISEILYFWNNSSWEITYKETFTYNANNKVMEALFQDWGSISNQYTNSWKENYVYNSNNQLIQNISQYWNGYQWVNSYQLTISYNSNQINVATGSDWNGSAWVNDYKYTATYSGGNLTQLLSEVWNGSQWNVDSRDLFTYNANNNITLTEYEEWNGSSWILILSHSFSIDANGNRTEDTEIDNSFNLKHVYAYDNSSLLSNYAHPFKDKTGIDYLFESFPYVNKILTQTEYQLNNSSNQYDLTGRTTYNYNSTLSIEEINVENEKISFYPNPVKNDLTFTTEVNDLKIIDINGRTVKDFKNKSTNYNVSELNNGTFIIIGKTKEGRVFSQKMIKKD